MLKSLASTQYFTYKDNKISKIIRKKTVLRKETVPFVEDGMGRGCNINSNSSK